MNAASMHPQVKNRVLLLLGVYIFATATFARVLFDGRPYVGSEEQHAEIRSIAKASIAARASATEALPTTTRVPRSIKGRDNATEPDIDNARSLVATALKDSAPANRARLNVPARNIYTPKGSSESKSKARDVTNLPPISTKLAAAAALVAELDAAALERNGTLRHDYSVFDALRNRNGQNTKIQKRQTSSFWMEGIGHYGTQLNNPNYTVWRNVKDYGAIGNGVTDDTAAINLAISDGNRCGAHCESASNKGAVVYFPSGTYLVSTPIISLYNTQLVGNANSFPVILAAPSFLGLGVISSDVYYPDGGGTSWYLQTSNFYRQIRYFTIDISLATRGTFDNPIAGIHWQVAQATSLYQINFMASKTAGSNQVGIFAENGSGGFMGELSFIGGSYGLKGGNQQFTSQSMSFSNVETAIQLFWDWGWSWKSVSIDSCNIGFDLIAQDGVTRGIGSLMLTDSGFTNTPKAILVFPPNAAVASGTTGITPDNVAFSNVGAAVIDTSGAVWLSGSTTTVDTWTLGNTYFGSNFATGYTSGTSFVTPRSPVLTVIPADGSSPAVGFAKYSYLERPKRTYAELSADSFVQMKWFAAGDGITDDTEAFQAVLDSLAGLGYVLYIDAGTYIFTDTVTIPSKLQIVGECWPSLMASGAKFNDELNPRPLIRVGAVGASPGNVELQDLLFTSTGTTAGLVAVEWNLPMDDTTTASAAMWDCHVRLGGAIGTSLQLADCPTTNVVTNSTGNVACKAGSMMFHITATGSAYIENVWLWTADHDIDDPQNRMVSVYVARGMLVESHGPVWLYGTASEHAVLYQYEFYGATDIYASMIQTESPYYQPTPPPPAPFHNSVGVFHGDPVPDCTYSTNEGCDASWALILEDSNHITIAGSGFYSWFQSYGQACVPNQDCQKAVVSISSNMNSSGVYLFNTITIGSVSMISGPSNELSVEIFADVNTNSNVSPWWSLITAYLAPNLTTFYRDNHNYYGLGDSFSAGIGAGATYSPDYVDPDPKNDCAKCVGAYPNQMKTKGEGLADARFRFFSCSGGKTDSIISPPGPGKVSQVELIRADGFTSGVGFSTLSIGGNNVGFSKVLSSCILWAKDDCEERFTRCEQRIAGTGTGVDALLQQNLTTSYRQIIAEMTETEFVLFVTGYAKFFNENTDECNTKKMLPFIIPGRTRPLLTQALRKRTNDAVLALNTAIQQAIATINAEEVRKGTLRRVRFVDIDDLLEGHRFCDTNAQGNYQWKDDAWFFPPVVGWDRTKPPPDDEDDGGELFVDGPTSIRSIDIATCDDTADDSGRWGDQFMCGLAQEVALSTSTNDTVQIENEDGVVIYDQDLDAMWTDWIFRAFHPKTIAYKIIAQRIYIWYWVHFW